MQQKKTKIYNNLFKKVNFFKYKGYNINNLKNIYTN